MESQKHEHELKILKKINFSAIVKFVTYGFYQHVGVWCCRDNANNPAPVWDTGDNELIYLWTRQKLITGDESRNLKIL